DPLELCRAEIRRRVERRGSLASLPDRPCPGELRHVGLTTRQVAALRIARGSRLIVPSRVLLQDQTQFAERLAVSSRGAAELRGESLIRAWALGNRQEETWQNRIQQPLHRVGAELSKRC